mgnify:FL=1|tara:strand:+ start:3410 stop:4801 length:1392 start_codon:yes stop_codon:yes gene_type:complete
MKRVEQYAIVKKNPIFRGYLEHFGNTSIDNDIPGMLSFFFIQGQLAVPYIRIPWGASHLDPRVHTFWIQSSRTGKSIAWEFIGDILKDIDIPTDLYTTGTDAGLIGGFEELKDGDGNIETIEKEGFLNGRKALNFDEGSIILNPNKHSQETVLYLQSACNPVGSNNNILVKHTKAGRIETESLVSLWITTYPPSGVKEYVLTKGIFQRVLLYWSNWGMDRRMNVSMRRADSAFKKTPKMKVSYEDITGYFRELERKMRNKVLEVTETKFVEWDNMSRDEQEELLQESMTDVLSADESFYPAMYTAIEDYYALLTGLGPGIGDVVASFIPAMENYTVILSTHIALMEDTWVVNDEHVDMAKEILYDLFNNLIEWLEGEVEIGAKIAEKANQKARWLAAHDASNPFDLGGRGDNWRKRSDVMAAYMNQNQVTRGTAYNHFNKWANNMFDQGKDGKVVFLRLRDDA